MFIYSVRAATVRFFGIICLSLVALITLIAFVPAYATGSTAVGSIRAAATDSEVSYRYDKIKTPADAADFLRQFGWEVADEPLEAREVTLPASFDNVFMEYNEMQKAQGLDLTRYRKKTVTRYTFAVTNHPDANGSPVFANVLVFRNRVIGGDICSAEAGGFVTGFEKGHT